MSKRRRRRKSNQLRGNVNNPNVPLTYNNMLETFSAALKTPSGLKVGINEMFTYSPWWRGVNLISGDTGKLPFITYRDMDGNPEEQKTHPTYRILRHHTGELTSNLWVQLMVTQGAVYGNGYSRIHRTRGAVSKLEFIDASRVVPMMSDDGRIVYEVQPKVESRGRVEQVAEMDMFHLRGLTIGALGGLSLAHYARNTIGRMLAVIGQQDDFFANGTQFEGFFSTPKRLRPDTAQRFLEQIQDSYGGFGNRFKRMVLEEDMKFMPNGVNPKDAMMIESLAFGVREIANFLNVPPHKLGDDSKTSHNSLEEENKAYFDQSICPWTCRLECEANHKLFNEQERSSGDWYTAFDTDKLTAGNLKDTVDAMSVAVQMGIVNRNEARKRLKLGPYPGGEVYLVPVNIQPHDMAGENQEPEPQTDVDQVIDDVIEDRAESIANRLYRAAVDASKGKEFLVKLEALPDKHRGVVAKMLKGLSRQFGCDADEMADDMITECIHVFVRAAASSPGWITEQLEETKPDAIAACVEVANKFRKGEPCTIGA